MASADESASTTLSVQNVDKHIRTLNRADVLRMLGISWDREVVGDVEKLHPVTVFHKSTLRVDRRNVPFLNEGAAGECCMGALLVRVGHKTATVKCYSTRLTSLSTVCAHCEQLWAVTDDNGIYELREDMPQAWARYRKGVHRTMKNWDSMKDMQHVFEKEVQAVKDLVHDSEFDVESAWPYMGYIAAQKTFMQHAGVLFEDAGRGRNPYPRTAKEQELIALFAHEMMRLWLRVAATVKKSDWMGHMQELQRKAKLVASAAKWAMQKEFPGDPVFVGPVVAADIVASGLIAADIRFRRMVQFVSANADDGERKLPGFSWGEAVDTFVEWANGVAIQATPPLRTVDKETNDATSVRSNKSRHLCKVPGRYS